MRHPIGAGLLALAALWPAGAARAACSIKQYGEMPITMMGLRPTLTAKVNGSEQTFIADSGAFFSMISPGTATDLGLKLAAPPYNLTISGVGGQAEIRVATVKAFTIIGATLPNVQFIVGGSEVGAAGLIGQNLLGNSDVEYDLPHGAIRLMRTTDCQRGNLAYWTKAGENYSVLTIEDRAAAGFHTVGAITINDTTVHAMFDTGAEATILSLGAAARAGLKPGMPGAKPAGYDSGLGRRMIETWIVPVKRIKIGDEEIANARIKIGNLGTGTEMLIGADFFISHRLFVSNSLHKLFFTYTGGPIFDLKVRGSDTAPAPVDSGAGTTAAVEPSLDAAALGRRGAVEAAQHDNARALSDIDRAVALAPSEPRYLLQRAALYLATDRAPLAAADIDAAIKLQGDNAEARMLRAELRLREKRKADAIEDLDAAAAAMGKAADQRLALAGLYEEAGALEKTIAQSTLWIANHPVDMKRPGALNMRCWTRALSGQELPQALDDCNAALRLNPRRPDILDSRGLVHLRMGDRDKAIVDYDAALSRNPKIAWSLYGRSIAERAGGQTAAAQTDREAALALDPELPALAKSYGIKD